MAQVMTRDVATARIQKEMRTQLPPIKPDFKNDLQKCKTKDTLLTNFFFEKNSYFS